MKLYLRKLIPFLFLVWTIGLTGCVDKMVYPAARYTVTGVTAYEVRPASATIVVLPAVAISLRSDFQIPANLQSFSVSYKTRLGQLIPEIALPETPQQLVIAGGAVTAINMSPYTRQVLDLYSVTDSDISPITATMLLTIHDINGNTSQVEAFCLLYKPE